MIDPKLNETPVEGIRSKPEAATPEERERLRQVSASLSVNDTIASNANLSVGGQGVDTSGVSAGAGAGAGLTRVDSIGSSMIEIVDGGRSSGTATVAADGRSAANSQFDHAEMSQLAYQAWCDRGCPSGSPEVDWQTAEEVLRRRQTATDNPRVASQSASAGGL